MVVISPKEANICSSSVKFSTNKLTVALSVTIKFTFKSTMVDLNVNLMVTDNATVSLFVENLTDEEHIFASFGEITTTLGTISFLSGPPRTTGISFTVNY